jgi:hypothetical protein
MFRWRRCISPIPKVKSFMFTRVGLERILVSAAIFYPSSRRGDTGPSFSPSAICCSVSAC